MVIALYNILGDLLKFITLLLLVIILIGSLRYTGKTGSSTGLVVALVALFGLFIVRELRKEKK